MPYLRFRQLAHCGIPWSRQHLRRLIAAGKFPAPVRIGQNTCTWIEDEVRSYLAQRRAERDAGGRSDAA